MGIVCGAAGHRPRQLEFQWSSLALVVASGISACPSVLSRAELPVKGWQNCLQNREGDANSGTTPQPHWLENGVADVAAQQQQQHLGRVCRPYRA